MSNNSRFEARVTEFRQRVEATLHQWLPPETLQPHHLHKAMRYAIFGGGKRIRPILVYATGETLGVPLEQLDGIASVLEIIHSYSLVHDDLPAMDNDDLRRGQPTCHKAFDEATAILVGDALQALAFYILTHDKKLTVSAEIRLQMIETLAHACGSRGMAGGQAIDLAAVGRQLNIFELEEMHIHKTGALIRASITLPALCAPTLSRPQFDGLDHYAKCLGLAFQIRDDILDEEGDTITLGKTSGTDRIRNKPTYPSIAGMPAAKARASDLGQQAILALASIGNEANLLHDLATYVVNRAN